MTTVMASNRPVIMLLGVPPPWGGGEIRAAAMARHFESRPGYILRTYARPRGSKKTQGRATAGNIGFGMAYVMRGVLLLICHRPQVLYLSLPKNMGAFLRAVPLISLGKWLGCRVCGELAGARFSFLEHPGLRRMIGMHALRRLASIRFLGASVASVYSSCQFNHVVVFPNGIECSASPAEYAVRARRKPLELLYVGALNRSKGVASLVRSVVECHRASCPVHLTLVGEWAAAGFQQEIERLILAMGIRPLVTFAGPVMGDEKWDYYRRAALLVHPTEWDGQPLTILEAMAMGLGIIASRVGAIPDTVDEGVNGTLLADTSPQTIASAIQNYVDNPDKLEGIMRANRSRYETFYTLETYLNHMEGWMESLRSHGNQTYGDNTVMSKDTRRKGLSKSPLHMYT